MPVVAEGATMVGLNLIQAANIRLIRKENSPAQASAADDESTHGVCLQGFENFHAC